LIGATISFDSFSEVVDCNYQGSLTSEQLLEEKVRLCQLPIVRKVKGS